MAQLSTCSSLRISLDRVRVLKERFFSDYNNGESPLSHELSEQMRARKQELEQNVAALEKEIFYFALEKETGIRKQYDSQVSLLRARGVLQERVTMNASQNKLESIFVVRGIDGKEYPVPSFEEVLQKSFEQREVLKIKMDQGFTKLLLVPFATSIMDLVNYASITGNVSAVRGNPAIVLGDVEGRMRYDSNCIGDSFQGFTKTTILNKADPESTFATNGWRVLLAQSTEEGRGIADARKENTQVVRGHILPRASLESSCAANEYLRLLFTSRLNEHSPYFAEKGMCFEDWIIASVCHFCETGKRLDSLDADGVEVFFLGCSVITKAFPGVDVSEAIMGCCKDDYGGMSVSTANPDDAFPDTNAHTVVRIL